MENQKQYPNISQGKNKTKTKVFIILSYLYKVGRPVRYQEIMEDTGLSYQTCMENVCFLKKLNLITKIPNEFHSDKDGKLKKRAVLISLNDSQTKNVKNLIRKRSYNG